MPESTRGNRAMQAVKHFMKRHGGGAIKRGNGHVSCVARNRLRENATSEASFYKSVLAQSRTGNRKKEKYRGDNTSLSRSLPGRVFKQRRRSLDAASGPFAGGCFTARRTKEENPLPSALSPYRARSLIITCQNGLEGATGPASRRCRRLLFSFRFSQLGLISAIFPRRCIQRNGQINEPRGGGETARKSMRHE